MYRLKQRTRENGQLLCEITFYGNSRVEVIDMLRKWQSDRLAFVGPTFEDDICVEWDEPKKENGQIPLALPLDT